MPTATDVFAKVRGHERSEQLRAAREADLLPYFRRLEGPAGPVVEMEGAERIMLGSNNYLGLTADPRVRQAARDALDKYGTGLTGSRLLNGTLDLHLDLERELAEWMGTEEAIVFSTGHQANVGTLGTILAPGDTVIVDSADHASILDGCLISKAKLRPFKHNRLDRLEKMLQRAAEDGGGVLVVVDGVFSMEGDIAPLPRIVELCKAYGARLMVDEAHGAGVLGARGAGASELFGVEADVDLRMGTFSKSLASCGGFIAGPHEVIDFLRISEPRLPVHRERRSRRRGRRSGRAADHPQPEGPELFARVLDNAQYLSRGLRELGFRVIQGEPAITPVVPVAGRGRLEGRAALARPLRRRRLRQRGDPSGRPARRRAAAHERHGDPRPGRPGPRAGCISKRQTKVRIRARPLAGTGRIADSPNGNTSRKKGALCECGGWLSVDRRGDGGLASSLGRSATRTVPG